jgi:hypothetical protein
MPRMTAEAALYPPIAHYRGRGAQPSRASGALTPAAFTKAKKILGGYFECIEDCTDRCLDAGGNYYMCAGACAFVCAPVIIDPDTAV